MRDLHCGVLVIGGGIAGLEAAIEAARGGADVLLVSKGDCASRSVLGFNAPVSLEDSPVLFREDILRGSWGLGEESLARTLAGESRESVRRMEEMGLVFDRADGKAYHLLQPLGCSVPRLVHAGNLTGKESLPLLRQKALSLGVRIPDDTMALALFRDEEGVYAALLLSLSSFTPTAVRFTACVLCTGGAHLMENSTYPMEETADGYAMAYEAGATLTDMEFIQHEPCRCLWPKPLGLSTTVLRRGGILRNARGERFVLKAYPSESDVPKDQLARLIAEEIVSGRASEHGGVYLDLTGVPKEEITVHHSMYYRRFLDAGLDLTRDIIEVGPAAHSIMGGVRIAPDCATDVPGLFAAGEVTGGLHGANRIGGNAGSEIYVFGRLAGQSAAAYVSKAAPRPERDVPVSPFLPAAGGREEAFFTEHTVRIRRLLARALGPVRSAEPLRDALGQLRETEESLRAPALDWRAQKARVEALHLCRTGSLSCAAALKREESRGVHYRSDFPRRDDARFGHSLYQSIRLPFMVPAQQRIQVRA